MFEKKYKYILKYVTFITSALTSVVISCMLGREFLIKFIKQHDTVFMYRQEGTEFIVKFAHPHDCFPFLIIIIKNNYYVYDTTYVH